MNRSNNVPYIPSAMPQVPAAAYRPPPPGRVPQGFREAMKHISVKLAENSNITASADMAAMASAAPRSAGKSSVPKWKSSFKPIGEGDNSPNESTERRDRVEHLELYDPLLSDSNHETSPSHHRRCSPSNQDNSLGCQRLSSNKGCCKKSRWDIPYSEPGSQPLDTGDSSPESEATQSRGLSPGQRLPEKRAYSPDTEPLVPSGYGSTSRPLDHRVGSPDTLIHGSSTQMFPAPYGAQRTNGEERIPEYNREVSPMTTAGRISPPRLQRDYRHQVGYVETVFSGVGKIPPSTEVTRNRKKHLIMDKSPITCDLCDVELANGQELQDHLESKTHWDTLEHIQQENNYDDMAIAFLQEVMVYKSRQCSRAIEGPVLQALQENDHMTKIEIFHCAACNVFLSTSASSVHTHITSQEHLSNTKEFEVQQRHSCLDKAETMMKELKPQFEHFQKGGSPFE